MKGYVRKPLLNCVCKWVVVCFAFTASCVWSANESPVQTFYIPRPEDEMLQSLQTIAAGITGEWQPTDPIQSYVSIAVFADNTVIYYDQWENGFDPDIANPTNRYNALTNPGGTQIWGDGDPSNGYPPGYTTDVLSAGDVVLLTNAVVSASRGSVIDFDGGDKIAVTKPIALTRATWATGSATLFANANEVYDTSFWGTSYICPVGTNIADSVDYQMFEYTGLSIMAGAGGASVQVDADADGVFETNCVLAEGEACLINGGMCVGGRIVSDKPVQVDLLTADIYDNFESRFIRLLPTAFWSSSLTTPVSTPASVTNSSTVYTAGTTVWLYNPGTNALSVQYITRSGSAMSTNTLSVPGGTAGGYLKQVLPDGYGSRFVNTNDLPFYGIATVDSTGTTLSSSGGGGSNRTWDWGFALVPEPSLTPQVLVGLGIGRDPTSTVNPDENSSPVWVTPIGNGNSTVTVYVDYDSDPTTGALVDPNGNRYDVAYSARELDRLKIYNPAGDQTGMLVYTLDDGVKLAAAWGEDPLTATPGSPGLDMGTGIPPFPLFVARKKSVLLIDSDNDGYVTPGDTLQYSIIIENTGRQPVTDLDVQDSLPSGLTYQTNTTEFVNESSITNTIADNAVPPFSTVFPLDEGGTTLPESYLPVRSSWAVSYITRVKGYKDLPTGTVSLQNTAKVGGSGLTTTNTVVTPIYGRIGDYVWHDLNEDGLQSVGEPGINGVIVSLLNDNGTTVLDQYGVPMTIVTSNGIDGAAGYYQFKGVEAGTYKLAFASPAGFQPTDENSDGMGIEGATNSDVDVLSGQTAVFSIAAGESITTVDAGFIEKRASVSGTVRFDVGDDGVVDPEDTQGLVGVTVRLLDAASNVVASAQTLSDGSYLFSDIRAGSYTLVQILPQGYTNTYDVVGANDLCIPVTLTAGETSTGNDFYDGISVANLRNKVLYLSEPGLALDRTDPVATGDSTTAQTSILSNGVGVATIGVASVSTGMTTVASGSLITCVVSHLVPNGTGRLMLVGVSENISSSGGTDGRITGVTYGSSTLTGIGGVTNNDEIVSLFALLNPPVGTANVTVTYATAPQQYSVVGVASFTNVNQTTPYGAFFSNGGSSASPSLTLTSAEGELVVDCVAFQSRSLTGVGAGQTLLWKAASNGGYANGGGSTKAGASSVTTTWSAASSMYWAIGGVSLKPMSLPVSGSSVTFTQQPAFATSFLLPAGAVVTVTNFIAVVGGAMPTNPAIVASLEYGNTAFLTLSNPVYRAASGSLVWQQVVPTNVSFTAGQTLNYTVSSSETGATFRVLYDSVSYPSKIILPTPTYIGVSDLGVYSDAYPDGSLVTTSTSTSKRYVRVTVTDPFGAYDIASVGLLIDGPGASGDVNALLTDAQVVASNAFSKTYEYAWQTIALNGSYTLTVIANEGTEGITATNTVTHLLVQPVAAVGDFVWSDTNGNGQQDAGEPGLANAVVSLYNSNSVVIAVTTSTVSGAYQFVGIEPGVYTLGFTPPAGYLFTTSNVGDVATDSDPSPETGRTAAVALLGNATNQTVDAGFYLLGSLSGVVRSDQNGNGIADTSDTNGIAGVTVQLFNAASNVVATAVTDANGAYTFADLPPCSYTVRETDAAGWYSTTDTYGANDNLVTVALTSGQSSTGNNFYDARWAAVGDFVWLDANGNGQQDVGETGLAGVAVRLYNTNGVVMAVTTSAVSGAYAFTNLAAGTYTVGFTPPSGYLFTTSNVGSDLTDSDPLAGTNRTAAVTLASGQSDTTLDAGFISSASVSGYVRVDVNGDGVVDVADTAGVAGVTVQLLDAASNEVASAVTASDGSYTFTDLRPGTYTVRETDLAGWYSTADVYGPNDNLVSVTLTLGQTSTGNNFYDTQKASIGDFVWEDTNGNGQQDIGETGLSGVVVRLYGTNGVVAGVTTSTVSGTYAFTNLTAGSYTVGFEPPAGYLFTASNVGSDLTDSDPLAGTNRTAAVTLVSGQSDTSVDAGFYQTASVSGTVRVDADGDGVIDAEDTVGIAGVTILLLDTSSNLVATASTASSGGYTFSGVTPGSYTVAQVLPGGYTNTLDTAAPNDLRIPLTVGSGQALTVNDFYDALSGVTARNKVLYLSDPNQALDRIDPVATGDQSTAMSAELYVPSIANVTNSSASANNRTLTFSHTVPAGTNRLLLVSLAVRSTTANVTAASYGTTALSLCGSNAAASNVRVFIYRLVNPTPGTANVSVTLSSSTRITAGASSFIGVNQSQPVGTFASAQGYSASPSVTVSTTPGTVVYDALAMYSSSTVMANSGQSQLWENDAQKLIAGGSSAKSATTSSTTTGWTCSGGLAYWTLGVVAIQPATGSPSTTFTQSPAFAMPFALSSGTIVSVTNFVNVTNGTLPANPSVSAMLASGGTTFATLTNAFYNSVNGMLSWSGTLPSDVTLPAGAAISLNVSNNQANVGFRIRYDSATYPSKVILPTTSIIQVPSVGVYDATYPGGTLVATSPTTAQRYVRVTVTDPFGAYDITSAGLVIDGPGSSGDVSATLTDAHVVSSNAWSKTYEYPWQTLALAGTYALTVTANEGTEGITATGMVTQTLLPRPAVIGDFAWVDTNGNGQQDAGESGLEGVAVTLYNSNNVVIAVATSSVSGAYQFIGVTPGSYTLAFEPPTGYLFTTSVVGNAATDSNPLTGTNRTAVVVLTDGGTNLTVDAGFYLPASLSGYARCDANGNGVVETEDTIRIAGVTVRLLDALSNVVATAVTGSDGSYVFNNLVPGAYTVCETDLSGWYSTADASAPNDNQISVTLVSGQTSVDNNFYDTQYASLGDRVWNDLDGDGYQDTFEPGVSNLLVYIDVNSNGVFDAGEPSAITASNGWYVITGLAAGAYTVRVDASTLPVAMLPTYDLNGALDHTATVTLTSGQNRTDVDFGYRSTVTYAIRGQVRDDYDANGSFSDLDKPVGGVVVSLYTDPNGDGNPGDGALVASRLTTADGCYAFTNLLSGAYVVVESDPAHSESTADVVGADDNRVPVIINNADSVGNDFLDAVDPTGYLYDVADGRIVPGGSISVSGAGAVVLMDGSTGEYSFISTNSTATVYTIAVTPPSGYVLDSTRLPAGSLFDATSDTHAIVLGSYESATNHGYLVDCSAASNTYYFVFELAPGDVPVINNNFPLVRTATLGDRVWLDANGNGAQDTGEAGVSNVAVRLLDASSNLVASTLTDVSGLYLFTNLPPATYQIQFTAPSQYVFAVCDAAVTNDFADSDADRTTGLTPWLTLAAGETNLTVDAGLYVPAAVFGYVFADADNDLIRDRGDVLSSNVIVRLIVDGVTVDSVRTDADGYYRFENVQPGTVTVLVSRVSRTLVGVPTDEPAASDVNRNRALPDTDGEYAYISDVVVSGYGVQSETPGEPLNFGFTTTSLSTALDVSVYASGDGSVMLELWTSDENGYGDITVYAWINNAWVEVGRVPADQVVGEGSNKYVIQVQGLTVGTAYSFKIVDESGHIHYSDSPVTVESIKMDSVCLDMDTFVFSVNTQYERRYNVMMSTNLNASANEWAVEYASVKTNGAWAAYSKKPFKAKAQKKTVIRVPVNQKKAFYKVLMLEDDN